jgi:nucleoside-diphosphate-sugar epimerase
VHRLADDDADPLAAFRRANRDATAALAEAAAAAGVARFVFLSSIGVHGAETFGRPFSAADTPAPHSPYTISKLEAENELARIAAERGLEVVVLRPPLVYGPDAPGNFATLLRAVDRGLPLPLGAIHNRRSFVAIDNLVDLIALVDSPPRGSRPGVPGQRRRRPVDHRACCVAPARALDRPARLLPVPANALRRVLSLLGRAELGQRLCGSLEVDISATLCAPGLAAPGRRRRGARRDGATFPVRCRSRRPGKRVTIAIR